MILTMSLNGTGSCQSIIYNLVLLQQNLTKLMDLEGGIQEDEQVRQAMMTVLVTCLDDHLQRMTST